MPPRDGDAKQEGEQTGAYRLLDVLYRQYHQQIDVIVADALYASRVFVETVLKHVWNVVIRLKDSQRLTIQSDTQRPESPTPFGFPGQNAIK